MEERVRAFLEDQHSAGMITVHADGAPHSSRVGIALVDGKLWSSGTRDRVRTGNLSRDPRSGLFVFDSASPKWLGLETTATVLDGPDVPGLSLRLFRAMQGKPDSTEKLAWFGGELTEEEFVKAMRREGRVIYEFTVLRSYGYY